MKLTSVSTFSTANGRQLDPRTVLLYLLVFNIISFSQPAKIVQYSSMTLGLLALVYCQRRQTALRLGVTYVLLSIAGITLALVRQPLITGFAFMLVTATHFFPVVTISVLLIKTVRISSLTYTLRRWRCPASLTVAIALVVRFFPTVSEQWHALRLGLTVRGIRFSWLHPFQTVQLILVPMITNLSLVADELTTAALTRGIGEGNHFSAYWPVRLKIADVIFIAALGILFITTILIREGVIAK